MKAYVVATLGALWLTLALPGTVTCLPAQARPRPPQLQQFRFDRYVVDYPASYTPQPLPPGSTGGLLIRGAPYGFMFVVMAKPDSDTVVPQGRALVNIMLERFSRANRIVSRKDSDIPEAELAGRYLLGKSLEVDTEKGLLLHVNLYLKVIGERRVLVGFATITSDSAPADLRHLLTTDPARVAEEFHAMAASLRLRTR